MKYPFIRLVRFFVNLAFYSYLVLIPLFWFMMLSEYFSAGSDQVMVTQIQHGQLQNAGARADQHVAVAGGAPFALEETAATLWVKTESLAHFIFFSNVGDTNGFSMNFITMFFGLALIFLLKKVLDSLHKKEIFTPENARRIMLMGWVLIAKYFYLVAISFWMSNFLKTLDLPYQTAMGLSPDAGDFHLGMLIFCIGLVYKESVKLKQEAALVI